MQTYKLLWHVGLLANCTLFGLLFVFSPSLFTKSCKTLTQVSLLLGEDWLDRGASVLLQYGQTQYDIAWKMSRYGDFSGPYFPIFSLSARKYEPEKKCVFGHFLRKARNCHALSSFHVIGK